MYIFFLVISLFFYTFLEANEKFFTWPILTENFDSRISSLFGESRGDHFHNGIDISSENEPVRAIGYGTVVYSRYSSDDPFLNPLGTGNCVWVAHEKGYLSGYLHLKDGREKGFLSKEDIMQSEVLGRTGNTGHSKGSHLHFILARDYGRVLVNPLLFLPPVQDTLPPQITQVILTNNEKYTFINNGDSINISKPFPISVSIFDKTNKAGFERGIQRVIFKFNGKKYKEVQFNQIFLKDRYWVNDEGFKFEELYFKNNYFIGELNFLSGENSIEIEAFDFNRNSTKKIISFYVNRIK